MNPSSTLALHPFPRTLQLPHFFDIYTSFFFFILLWRGVHLGQSFYTPFSLVQRIFFVYSSLLSIFWRLLLHINSFFQRFNFTFSPLGDLALPLLTLATSFRCAHNLLDLRSHLFH